MAYKVKKKGKGKDMEVEEPKSKAGKVKYTKKGQPYVIDPKTGRAKFIKKAKK